MIRIISRTETMTARDGTTLVADIYQPDTGGPWPVLLMRQAYGRRIGTSLCYAPPEWYARHGYIVVLQDARGRGDSGGSFDLFEHEAEDGFDTIAWAAALPDSTGVVGMFGFSFQGSNQLLAAGLRPQALRAIAPAMIGWDLRTDWAYENGAFALRANIGWATQLAAETARLSGDMEAHAALSAAAKAAPGGARPAHPAHEALLARYSHYVTWRETPDADPYWDRISPSAHQAGIVALKPAILLIGGWYDSHLPGTLAAYRALSPHLDARLIVGPWAHFPWDRYVGERDFGVDAITDIDQRQIAFFDAALKGRPWDAPRVRLFDMGADCWRDLAGLSDATGALYPSGSGRAAIDTRDGVLADTAPHVASAERLTLDPWRPAGPCGGSFGLPPGPVDRAKTDARSDVLTFTTASFTQTRLLAGMVSATLAVTSEHPSFDLHATLSRIDADGHVWPLAEGFATASPGRVSVPMRGTCAMVAQGERLRLSVTLACFPAFPLNPGNGAAAVNAAIGQCLVTTIHLRCGAGETELSLPWHDSVPNIGDLP